MLPISEIFPSLKQALNQQTQIIIEAPTGAGKSTHLPLFLLSELDSNLGKILLLEPRRLAARSIAHYLAEQLGEKVGEKVGYRMRGDTKVGPDTQLEIVTEGVLTRLIQADPELADYQMVIFDEFHERNLHGDLGLALVLDIQQGLREDLRLMVMSATLENQSLLALIPDAKCLTSAGRMYPVNCEYVGVTARHQVSSAIANLVHRLIAEGESGNLLVFLPGQREISQLAQLLALPRHVLVCPLYGALTLNEQRQAIAAPPSGQQKVVLATNIAETSLTIEGITVVIDSLLERRLILNNKTGIGSLQTRYISQGSAKQRLGRAGRLAPGKCFRMISQEQFGTLDKHLTPEILAADLTATVLELAAWGVTEPEQMQWLTAPNAARWQMGVNVLQEMAALDGQGKITSHGKAMAAFSAPPRIANMLLAAQQLEREYTLTGLTHLAANTMVILQRQTRQSNLEVECQQGLTAAENKLYQQALQQLGLSGKPALPLEYIGLVLALAFPDRIATRRSHSDAWLLSGGFAAQGESSLWHNAKFIVVADIGADPRGGDGQIYRAAALDIKHIEAYLGHWLQWHDSVIWHKQKQQIVAERQYRLGKIVLQRQPLNDVKPAQKQQALLQGLFSLDKLPFSEAALSFIHKVNTARQLLPELSLPDYTLATLEREVELWLVPYLGNIKSLQQLQQLDYLPLLKQRLDWPQQQALDSALPNYYVTPAGSQARICYDADKPPQIEVKMQHMFGLNETPSVAKGRLALTVLLLSPAGRPLQTTQDLAGFWQGSYQAVQKEMKGRYPKHFWPDDPANAIATTKTKKYMDVKN
ncbi:ATP-dependent helicase HrpB [Motilimonas pumila]|uniref:ATP-dependent helicase HrpB n=1 Tax=Motilimonas pumila TaxID=2303987 RepID=UPI00131420EF|nr:ATP-dependent helicase HrpB [Motilimonas pumila]